MAFFLRLIFRQNVKNSQLRGIIVTICDHMWPTTCCQVIPNPNDHCDHVWPNVTTCDQVLTNLQRSVGGQKGNVWPNLVNMNPCDPCDHMWPPVTRWYQTAESCGRPKKVTHPNQIWSVRTRVVNMTICDHQLPNPVTPVTHSKYSSYPFQILQLLQLPISVTPVTLSSIPVANSSYYSYTSYHFQLHQLPSPVTQSSYPN